MTLGWHEQHDVGTLVTHLIAQGHKKVRRGCDHIPESHCRRRPTCSSSKPTPFGNLGALWGRSMGAVAAILYSHSSDYIAHPPVALVLDSPFASFPRLVDDLIKKVPLALRMPYHQRRCPAIRPLRPRQANLSQPKWLSSYRARSACRALLCVQS